MNVREVTTVTGKTKWVAELPRRRNKDGSACMVEMPTRAAAVSELRRLYG